MKQFIKSLLQLTIRMPQPNTMLVVYLFLLFAACTTDSGTDFYGNQPIKSNRALKCTVLKVISQVPYIEAPVNQATITLYLSEADRKRVANPQHIVLTDSMGVAQINNLQATGYYAHISHNGLEDINAQISTPTNAIVNFETFVFQ